MSAKPEMTPQIDCDLLVIGSGSGRPLGRSDGRLAHRYQRPRPGRG